MPTRKRTHIANFSEVMTAHAVVVTDSTTSGGWIGWMPAKTTPAGTSASPENRIRFDVVIFIVLSFDERRSRACRDRVLCQAGRKAQPGPQPGHAAAWSRRSP